MEPPDRSGNRAVRTEQRDAVLEITLDRPPANAIDAATSRELGDVFARFRDDDELRVALLTGAGDRFFSAGWDLKSAVRGDTDDWGPGGFAGLTELFDLDKPVIAMVDGYAAGGGFELALACDLIVASTTATFFLPETRLGFVADAGGVLRLPRRLPRAIAMELLLTGRRMDAAEAERWGLVNRVAEPERVLDVARDLADEVARSAPLATRAVKAIVAAVEGLTAREGFEILRDGGVPAYGRVLASEDAREGPRAFVEGREPSWRGR